MTFLSHADKDKIIATNLARQLETHDFNVFLAHNDIVMGEDWDNKLKNEIYNRELFLVLLSRNFKNADFTNHEVGIATAHNKRIFSILIDDIEPYGFMYKFQARKINPKINPDEISKIADQLIQFTNEGKKLIDDLIEKLLASTSFVDANAIARELFEYTTFTPEQINNIAEAYVKNFEVSGSWTAGPNSLDLLSKNWNVVEQSLKKQIRAKLERR